MTTLSVDTKKVQKRKSASVNAVLNNSKKSCVRQDSNEMCDFTVLEKQ